MINEKNVMQQQDTRGREQHSAWYRNRRAQRAHVEASHLREESPLDGLEGEALKKAQLQRAKALAQKRAANRQLRKESISRVLDKSILASAKRNDNREKRAAAGPKPPIVKGARGSCTACGLEGVPVNRYPSREWMPATVVLAVSILLSLAVGWVLRGEL